MDDPNHTGQPQQVALLDAKPRKPKFPRRRDNLYYIDGQVYPSVTSILDCLAKPQLIHWAAKTAAGLVLADPDEWDTADKAASGIYRQRDKAGDRGSLIHSLVEAYARKSEVPWVPDEVKGYADAFWKWVAMAQPTPLFSETNVVSKRHSFAGTLDMIAAFPDKGIRLIDIKTTGRVYKEVGLQMAAYRNADILIPKTDPDARVDMVPVAETCVLLLRPDSTYEYHSVDGDFEVFLHLRAVYEWQRRAAG